MTQELRIGEVAERSGLATSAIRYYESLDILPSPVRADSGYRGYSEDDLDLVTFVARLRSLEFPLSEVREIVALRREGKAPCRAVRSAITSETKVIDSRIRDLQNLRTELKALEKRAEGLPDDWPTACVCNVLGAPQ